MRESNHSGRRGGGAADRRLRLARAATNWNQAPASAQQITGAGSTFVYPVLSAWAADYQKQSGTSINYQSIGSGGGISQVKAGTVDFGATDQPLAIRRAREARTSPSSRS